MQTCKILHSLNKIRELASEKNHVHLPAGCFQKNNAKEVQKYIFMPPIINKFISGELDNRQNVSKNFKSET